MDLPYFRKLATLIRYYILLMTTAAQSGHTTSSLSAVEVMTTLFFKYLRYDLDTPENPANDRVIFSKGHASPLFYALYAAAGKITEEELLQYRSFDSVLEGHPTRRFPFTEAATGSLGQGLSVGVGEALALKMQYQGMSSKGQGEDIVSLTTQYSHLDTPRIYVLLGDGELAEGSVWEAAAYASFKNLNNLTAIVDVSNLGQSEGTMYGDDAEIYARRFEAFGWATIIVDGHDFHHIDVAFQKTQTYNNGPSVILAKTIKGKGVSLWEGKNGWHSKQLNQEQFDVAVKELGEIDKEVRGVVQKPQQSVIPAQAGIHDEEGGGSPVKPGMTTIKYSADLIATKKAFGNAIERLGSAYPNLIVLDGDMKNSTHTDQFEKAFPERFLQMYIAEQNMVGVATGLSRRGLVPLLSTFAAFFTRAHDQIRMAALSGITMYFNGSYGGVSLGKDGPSQMGLEDIALFRSLHGSTVLYPCDPYQTERLVEQMLSAVSCQLSALVYIRTTREPTPVIYGPEEEFPIGGSKVFHAQSLSFPRRRESIPLEIDPRVKACPREGVGPEDDLDVESVTIVAAGITVHEGLKAQKLLEKEDIGVRVIDCYSIKPIDKAMLKKAANETKALIIAEDHYPEGGLGEAVKSALADDPKVPIYHLAIHRTPRSGDPQRLLDYEGICAEDIAETVRSFVKKITP